VRDAAYESMPKRNRADLHERFASWLGEKASSLLARSGRAALDRSDVPAALNLLSRALDLVPAATLLREALELYERKGDVADAFAKHVREAHPCSALPHEPVGPIDPGGPRRRGRKARAELEDVRRGGARGQSRPPLPGTVQRPGSASLAPKPMRRYRYRACSGRG